MQQYIFTDFNGIRQRPFLLLLEKVNVKARLQYHGGIVLGKSVIKQHLQANEIISFIIVILFEDPRFLCKMLPIRKFIIKQI